MAKIQTLGLPAGPMARPATATGPSRNSGRPDLAEYGATGTPIFGGFLRERGEYNPELMGLQAISTYEQMRRGDAQVAATLMAIKLPIRAAKWDVVVDDDASPVEVEAGEYVRTCLFKDNDFTAILKNALLMLDFGVAVHENCWEVVNNRVRLAKCAARLPLTFYRWLTSEDGEELEALEQLGYRGSEYVTVQVPANKMARFTYNQEGSNYTGLSLLRAMYQHWYLKTQLYKVDAIACERNGMGVPVITLGEDAKAEDIETAKAWVQSLVAHERTGLVLPNGFTFKLEGVTGTLRDPKSSIEHHNTAISMAGLAMFMMLGQSAHGSRALGSSMSDFFFMGLEATSNQIARVLTESTVKPLVDFNFAGIVNYPRVVPQQILTLKFESIVDALNKLAVSGVIEPDDTLESDMRERMGLPEVDKATVRSVPGPVTSKGLPVTGAPAGGKAPVEPADGEEVVERGAEGGDAGVDDEEPTEVEVAQAASVIKQAMADRRKAARKKEKLVAAAAKLAAMDVGSVHVDGPMGTGPRMRRSPKGVEVHMALSDIISSLDKGRDDVAAALRSARPAIQAEIVHKVMNRPVGDMHRASVAADQKLVDQVQGVLQGVHDFGRDQVGKERAKQKAGAAIPDAAKVRMSSARSKDPVGLYADGVVGEFTNTLSARATNAAIDWKRKSGLTDGQVIQGVQSDLNDQSDKWIDGVAGKGANEAFAEGRSAGFADYADEISSFIYSALLDLNTCEACAAADGQEGPTEDSIPDTPNPDCDGGDKCRCVQVAVFADEAQSQK